MKAQQNSLLPPIHPAISATHIRSLQDYSLWEKQVRLALKRELDHQVEVRRDLQRQQLFLQVRDRQEASFSAEKEQIQRHKERLRRMKTEQQYMADNRSLMEMRPPKHALRNTKQPKWMQEEQSEDHALMRLGDTEALRKKQTRDRFIHQNQVNSIQAQIRGRMKAKRRKMSAQARDRMARDEDHYYEDRNKQQLRHQKKYLKTTGHDYLEELKRQAECQKQRLALRHNKRTHHRRNQSPADREQGVSPARIGLLPIAGDRQQQMALVEHSLFNEKPARVEMKQTVRAAMSQGGRTVSTTSNPQSPVKQEMKRMESKKVAKQREEGKQSEREELARRVPGTRSSRMDSGPRPLRNYKCYDIITGVDKIFSA